MSDGAGRRLFDVRAGEGAAVATTLFLSFLVGIPRAFTFTVANTAFVEALGPGALPWAYAVGAPVVAGAGLVFVWIQRRRGLVGAGVAGAILFAALHVAAHLALGLEGVASFVAFGLVVLTEAEFTFTSVTFWGVANRVFTVRQAARLFGLVSVGQAAPAVLGGLAIPSLVAVVPVSALLLISAAGHIGIALLMGRGLRRLGAWREAPPDTGATAERPSVTRLLADPYLRGVALLIGLQVVVFYGVDNAFYVAAEARLGRGEVMAAFLGRFLIGLGLASAVFQLGVSGRWRRWLGLRSALVSTPLTLLVLALLALFAPRLEPNPWAVFVLVVLLKLWERIAVEAIHSPSYYSLFLPLPAETRGPAQTTLESVIAQAATIAGGLGLIAVNEAFDLGLPGLLAAIGVAAAAWALVAGRLSGRYRDVLRSALAGRRLEPGALPIADATTIDLLVEEAHGGDPARILRSVELLEELEAERLAEVSVTLLAHPHPRVVEAAARLLERHPDPRYAPALRAKLAETGEASTLARIARALGAAAGPSALPDLLPLLEAPNPRVRAGAAAALARYTGAEGLAAGRAALEALAASSAAPRRRLAARALGSAHRPELAPVLRPLTKDLDAEVARTALWAAGRVGAPAILAAPVLEALERPGMVSEAARAAARLGPSALPDIARALAASAKSAEPGARLGAQRLLRVLSFDASPDARALLFRYLGPRTTRRAALAGLARSGARLSGEERAALEARLDEELETARLLLSAELERVGARSALLARGLEEEGIELRDRVLLVLGLLYDAAAIEEARRHRAPASPEADALALELVEAALPDEVAARVLPALESGPAGPRLERLGGGAPNVLGRLAAGDRVGPLLAELARVALEGHPPDTRLRALAALGEVELFEHLGLEHLALVASRAELRRFDRGDRLLRLDEPEDRVVVLVDGEARWAGAGAPPAGRVAPSDLALVRPRPRARELVATSAGLALSLGSERLKDLLDDAPDAAWRILEHLCKRARGTASGHAAPAEPRLEVPQLPYSELLRLMRELEVLPAFARVPSATLAGVARFAREVALEPGETFIEEGATDATLYVLLSGAAWVDRQGERVARVSAPAVFGELAAILPAARSATIVADTPSRALALPREALYALMQEDRGILALMLELVVARLPDGASAQPTRLRIPVEDTTV